jgi:hypothetical protein
MRFYQGQDSAFVNGNGLEGGPGTNCLGQWVKVTSLTGTTLGFEPPLFWTYQSTFAPASKQPINASSLQPFCEFAGLEDLCITNTSTASSSQANIFGQFVANSWIKNVRSVDGYGKHLEMWSWYRGEVRDSVFYQSLPGGGLTSSRGYGINLGTPNGGNLVPEINTGNLIENNAFDRLRTGILLGYGASGNVIGYNYFKLPISESATIQKMDIAIHSAHPMMNLIEGNDLYKLDADFFHGSGSHNVAFANNLKGRATNYVSSLYSVGLSVWQRWYTVAGNILGYASLEAEVEALTSPTGVVAYEQVAPTPGTFGNSYYPFVLDYDGEGRATNEFDGLTAPSTTRQGNYDYILPGQRWDPDFPDHDLPDSFYYSERPSWYPTGYTWPPFNATTVGVNIIPAKYWYNTYGVWDGGGGGSSGGVVLPVVVSGSIRLRGAVNFSVQ